MTFLAALIVALASSVVVEANVVRKTNVTRAQPDEPVGTPEPLDAVFSVLIDHIMEVSKSPRNATLPTIPPAKIPRVCSAAPPGQKRNSSKISVFDTLVDCALSLGVKSTPASSFVQPLEEVNQGDIRLWNGSTWGFDSVFRARPTMLQRGRQPGSLNLYMAIGLRRLQFRFRYEVKAAPPHSGTLQGRVTPLVVLAHVYLRLPCQVQLQQLSIKMGNFQLQRTTISPNNGTVFKQDSKNIGEAMRGEIKLIEQKAKAEIQRELNLITNSLFCKKTMSKV